MPRPLGPAGDGSARTISVTLSPDYWRQLQTMAAHLGIAPEELVQLSTRHILAGPEDAFARMVDFVLMENAAFYHRLA